MVTPNETPAAFFYHSRSSRCGDLLFRMGILYRRSAESNRACRGLARRLDSRYPARPLASEKQPSQEVDGENLITLIMPLPGVLSVIACFRQLRI